MSLLLDGVEAADALLRDLYGLAPLAKATPNPLLPRGFDALVRGMVRDLKGAADTLERRVVQQYIKLLDRDWSKLSPEAREKAFRQAAENLLGFGPDVGAAVAAVVRHVGPTVIQGTKAAAAHADDLKIVPSFNAVDARMVRAAADHQAHFVRDEYGRRSEALSVKARAVVAQSMEDGLDRYDTADRLQDELGAAFEARARSYWQVVASTFVARARTFGHLSSFEEAGVEAYEFSAVLDEVTTEVCRFMDGKTFSTSRSLARYAEVADAPDPEQVKDLQPWAATGKAEGGGLALFYKAGGARQMIARVDEPGAGAKDRVGRYSSAMDAAGLQKAGLSAPPLHGHCRSTILPVFGSVSVPGRPEPAPPPPPPEQPKKPAEPKKPPAPKPPRAVGPTEEGVRAFGTAVSSGLDVILKPTPVPPGELASAEVKARRATRDLMKSYGVVSRDTTFRARFADSRGERRGADKLSVVEQRDLGTGAVADHGWDGAVRIAKPHAAQARTVTRNLAKDPRAYVGKTLAEVNDATSPLRYIIHEELHGASRCLPEAYRGAGVGMEEAATEILARKFTREVLGYKLTGATAQDVPHGLPTARDIGGVLTYRHHRSGGSYNNYIEGLFQKTAEVAGHDGIHERIEGALLRMRQGTGDEPGWTTGNEQIKAYVKELKLPKADADRLYGALVGLQSPLG